jgi:hypothetical protein
MFYVEDTTNIEEITQHDENLLVLDGTTYLDDCTDNPAETEENQSQTFLEYLGHFFKVHR